VSQDKTRFDDNSSDPIDFHQLIERAREGDNQAIGELLQQHRDYLLLVANQELDDALQAKLGASDLVQESMFTAQANFQQFHGTTRQELLAWLRRILHNDLLHAQRRYKSIQKRELAKEVPVDGSAGVGSQLQDVFQTPSTQAAQREEVAALRTAMHQLSEDYQRVLRMRHWQQLSFRQIGEQLHRSEDAARKLWSRAVLKLQEIIEARSPDLVSAREKRGEQQP
jgi:RNA polymerase sigma-70 factor (ECF subfamily)